MPLRHREVHLWFVDLHAPPGLLSHFFSLLSRDERERAERFRFDAHRRRYVVRRGFLRWLLGRYLGRPGDSLLFGYGAAGKPFLVREQQPSADPQEYLTFNLSDSEDVALYAFGHGVELGVDVEHLREMPDALSIADYSFSKKEQAALAALPPEQTSLGFFHGWTRKEAYLKAVGTGLAAPLDSFDVTLAPGEAPRMLTLEGDAGRAARWYFEHFRPAENYIGALAIEGEPPTGGGWRVGTWAFTP